MLRGRLLLRFYIIISYMGLGAGMLIGMTWDDASRMALAIILFLIGIMCHFMKGTFGFYFSIAFNSVGLGLAMNVIMSYFEVNFHHEYILFAVGVSLFIYIALVYLASMKWANNLGFFLSFWGMFIVYIGIIVILNNYNNDLTRFLFAIFHLGALYIIAMFYTGQQTELLLRNSSVASFAILAIAIVVAFLAIIAKAGGDDIDFDFGGSKKSKSRRGSYYHRHHYHHNDYLWYSTIYGNRNRRRYNSYSRPKYETDLERKQREEREQEEKDLMPNENNNQKRLTEDVDEWDY